jgi:hypothetical protein
MMNYINIVWNFIFGYPFRMSLGEFPSALHGNVTPLPKWYGVGYRSAKTTQFICYPIPFNFFVQWWLDFYRRMKCRDMVYWEKIEQNIRQFVIQEFLIQQTINNLKASKDLAGAAVWEKKLQRAYEVWHGERDKMILEQSGSPKPSAPKTEENAGANDPLRK